MKVKLIANEELDTDLSSVIGVVFEAKLLDKKGTCLIPISEFEKHGITLLYSDFGYVFGGGVLFLSREVEVLG